MSDKNSDWVYDELLCFLGSAFFQIPVNGFIDTKSLIFDPSVEDTEEYKQCHQEYKQLVEALLEAFMKDTKLKQEDVIMALNDMNSKTDLREVFQGLFELVLAMDDYRTFVGLMTHHNIDLQQQALMLIIKTQNYLPDSLTDVESKSSPSAPRGLLESNEEEIMRKVLEQSRMEYEAEQKKLMKQEINDKKINKAVFELARMEVGQFDAQQQAEREKMNAALTNLTIESKLPQGTIQPAASRPPEQPTLKKQEQAVIGKPGICKPYHLDSDSHSIVNNASSGLEILAKSRTTGISSNEAASNWIKTAQDETHTGHSHAVQQAVTAVAGMNEDEIKKRQVYLRQQRDKLVAMKKQEREKQLLSAEKNNPSRPMSAQAARQSLQAGINTEKKAVTPEEQKKIELRRQIANKLKEEMMREK